MLKSPGLYLLAGSILIAIWSISLNSPPAPIDATAPDTVFSSERAAVYLNEICQRPHSTGTAENKHVREYIAETCRKFGLETEIQNTTAVNRRAASFQNGSAVYSANVFNVVARLKGTGQTGKSVMVMGHFDSQPNTPGAGDDGASVAAMLETIQNLKSSGRKFQNDIVFLFTDAEELGMLGAVGYAQDTVQLKEIGILLNFDNRGNSGPLNMFETNPQNGWVVKEFLKAADHPFGNSLGYEIYRLLPNDTDFSIFRRAGISGLNQGFIYGYVNYHSPTDKPGDLDRGSLQHSGANMLSLVKHFGNTSLENTKADNVSYFDIAGGWIVSHPASWNPVLLAICVLMVIAYIALAWRKNAITIKGVIISVLMFLALVISLFLAGLLLSVAIGALYPAYKNFYSYNSYNAVFYQVAIISAGLLIFVLVYKFLLRKFSLASVMSGVLVVLSALLVLMYTAMPTAIFIVLFPLMFCTGGCIAALYNPHMAIPIVGSFPAL
ncbi:MAG TPA: M20/M25/M40 family metallo-hydrolase, partial [Cyclobacteriaceae bacterium]|nr:M20/M25/M40 family metallo-hydrolase [Cyclobacteriaceae bacterium]